MFNINTLYISKNDLSASEVSSGDLKSFFNEVTQIDSAYQKGISHRIHLDEFYIERLQLILKRDIEDRFIIPENCIGLFFLLQGKPEVCSSTCPLKDLKPGYHNIAYLPSSQGSLQCPCGEYDLFYVSIPEETFKTLSPQGQPVFENFIDHIQKGEVSTLREEPAHIRPQIYKIIEEIFQYDGNRHFQKIFTKAKIIELISLQFEQLCGHCPTQHPLNKKELEKMYQVRDFIISNLGEYRSLQQLAKMAGTNEYTLKKEFKALFGDTVFGFWQQLKMEKAQEMLLENQKTVKEIAEIIGYKNPQHFSTAFKRQFKLTPSQFKKNNL